MTWVRTVGTCCLVAVLAAALHLAAPAAAQDQAEDPSQDREAVLQELFLLNRRLEESRATLAGLEEQLGEVGAREQEALVRLAALQADLQRRREQYGRRLRYYREHGMRAPWILLFSSKSLPDLLWRLDALQEIMEYDARLARELVAAQEATAAEARRLADVRAEAEELRAAQEAEVAALEAAIAEKEAILAGLGDRRAEVEEALAAVETDWQTSAMPVLEALGEALQGIGTQGIRPDDVRVSLFPPGAVVTITADRLNEVLLSYEELSGLRVELDDDEDELLLSGYFDEVPLEIAGGFSVLPGGKLRFEPSLLRVRDFAVPRTAVDAIVADGYLDIDVSPMVQPPLALTAVDVVGGALIIRAGLR